MFPISAPFDKLLEKVTSHLLIEPDWPSILQICDLIRHNDVQPKYALSSLKKKLFSQNQHTALYALLVLESMVKNCGAPLHEELTTRAFCETLYELAKTTPHENVRQKLFELIQAWNFAFRKSPKHGALKDTMIQMKSEGFKFPTFHESDAMFNTDSSPEWADGDVCHRCHIAFSIIQRKHHCRACGQVFCGQCSQKTTTLPKYGIEKEVRVCDSCYDQASKAAAEKQENELSLEYLNSSLAQQSQTPPRKSDEELSEEEELQLALAISQSEAEAKEKEKEKFKLVNTSKAPSERTPPLEEQTNPELARYMNRSCWKSVKQNETSEACTASPSVPIETEEEPEALQTRKEIERTSEKEEKMDQILKKLDEINSSIQEMKKDNISVKTAIEDLRGLFKEREKKWEKDKLMITRIEGANDCE